MGEFREYGFVPWWSLCGTVEREELLRQFQMLQDAGIDEFFIYPNMGLYEPDYLSDAWFDMSDFIIQEAKRRGMRVWIYDELNWPSGTAGGLFPRNFPQYRLKNLCHECFTLVPGERFVFGRSDRCIRAFFRPKDDPNAKWTKAHFEDNVFFNETGTTILLRVFHIVICNDCPMSSRGTRSTWNQRGICDRLNPKAVRAWLSCVHDKYYERFKDECGKTVRGFFYDEPSFVHGIGNLPWTDGLDVDFKNKFGYDFLDYLPAFYEDFPGSEKVRYDFWTYTSDRFASSFTKTIAEWCAERNLELTGHCNAEEFYGQSGRLFYSGNIHRIQSYQQVPGMDLLGDHTPFHLGMGNKRKDSEIIAHNYFVTAKVVTSTARYIGAKRVMSETTGICDRNLPPRRSKTVWDWQTASGVSLFNLNGLGYTEKGFYKSTGSLYSLFQPWFHQFEKLSAFVRETSHFATGLLRTDVAVLDPETTIRTLTTITKEYERGITPKADVSTAVVESMAELLFAHIDMEMLFEEILDKSEVSNGVIHAPNAVFRVLVLPKAVILTASRAEKIRAFCKGGGLVFCIEERPSRTPDGQPLDFSDLPLVTPKELPARIRSCHPLPYSITGTGELFTALRDLDGVPTLFLANMGEAPADVQVTAESLPTPVVAKITGDDPWQLQGNKVHLEPYQSMFLRYGQTVPNQTPPVTWGARRTASLKLEGPWEYELSRPNNAFPCYDLGLAPNEPEQKDSANVQCWIPCSWSGCHDLEFTPDECPQYWLRSSFVVEDESVLNGLSVVYEEDDILRIRVNGQEIPLATSRYPLWTYETRKVDISSAAHAGENTLEILCKTSYWNREDKVNMFAMNILDPIVLHGNFATKFGEKVVTLSALPKKLHLGDLGKQGFPWFLGDVNYHVVLKGNQATALELPDIGDATVDVTLNGEFLGSRLWNPFRFELAGHLRPGDNDLIITIPTNLGNFIAHSFCTRYTPPTQIGLLQPPELS